VLIWNGYPLTDAEWAGIPDIAALAQQILGAERDNGAFQALLQAQRVVATPRGTKAPHRLPIQISPFLSHVLIMYLSDVFLME
jgi:hypothetical protein